MLLALYLLERVSRRKGNGPPALNLDKITSFTTIEGANPLARMLNAPRQAQHFPETSETNLALLRMQTLMC